MNEVAYRKLTEDFRTLKNDLGALVKPAGAVIAELRRPIEAKIAARRKAFAVRRATQLSHADALPQRAQPQVIDAAWIAVAIATVVGVALGLLLRRHD